MLKENLLRRNVLAGSLLLMFTSSLFGQDTTAQDEIIKLTPQSGVMVTGNIRDAISKKRSAWSAIEGGRLFCSHHG